MRLSALGVLFIAILVTGSYSGPAQGPITSEIDYFPTDEWQTANPEDHNMSSSVLEEMIQYMNESDINFHGLVVVRNGYIMAEQYWSYYTQDISHHLYSVTKSFTSTLIGIAIREGFIGSVTDPVLDYFPDLEIENLDSRKESMTIYHLLTMTPGVDWNEHNCSYTDPENMYNVMFGSTNPVQYFLNLPMVHDPGEHWVYSTGASHILSAIIVRTTGMSTRNFAMQYLFNPLNATCGAWNTDLQGVHIGGTQLWVPPRTMAKLGLLMLSNGSWDGAEILTAEFADHATRPLVSGAYDLSYGYQWWIDTANDLFLGLGSNGQYIIVSREYNLVVAITANCDDTSPWEAIAPYLQEALLDYRGSGGQIPIDILLFAGSITVVCLVLVATYLYRRRFASV